MPSESTHYDFLDWLRAIAILLLLFFHTGMIFVGWGWHIENSVPIAWLAWPMNIAHRLRMPLLFAISGAGLWYAMNHRSGIDVIRERTQRLIVPVLAGMLLVVPPQIYIERLFHHQWHGGYLDFLFTRVLQFHFYPRGDFGWLHMWFVVYLYTFVLILLPVLLWWRRGGLRLQPGAWLYLLALPLSLNEAVLKPLFPQTYTLVADWYAFNHYLLFTLYGFALASISGCWNWLASWRRVSLSFSLGSLTVLVVLLRMRIAQHGGITDSFLENVFTWASLLAVIGYSRRYLSFENGLLRWARDASYPIYILHQTFILIIGFFVIQQPWSAGLKYWIILIGTLLACVLLYEACICQFAITRILFGMKTSKPTRNHRVGLLALLKTRSSSFVPKINS
jgi:glucan biosynthesis protein C